MSDDDRPGQATLRFIGGLLRDWGLALVVFVGVLIVYQTLFGSRVPSMGPAMDFTLSDLQGSAFELSSADHEVVVLNFWFTSCPPCRAEIPELSQFAKDHPNIGLYGVSVDTMPAPRLARASKQLGIDYPVLHDPRADVARRYGIDTFPTTVVIRDMQIVSARVGAVSHATLDRMVGAATGH